MADAELLMYSMPWSGGVAPVLDSCSPSTRSAAVPPPSMLCHCLVVFVHPPVQKSRVKSQSTLLPSSCSTDCRTLAGLLGSLLLAGHDS